MRWAAGVEYDGTGFFGWQRQAQTPTVQECLEAALSQVANEPIVIHCAGRTDAGVHASGQVFHFDSTAERTMRSWVLGVNSNLPDGISLQWVQATESSFDARRCATSRRYQYVIANRWSRPALSRLQVTWVHHFLDDNLMHLAGQSLVGEHDFTSFRSVHCQAKHARRNLTSLSVSREGHLIRLDIEGNAFLHHMVRNIAGSLIAVGKGKKPASWVAEVLEAKDRKLAGITAPASGLTLLEVSYPSQWGLPAQPWPEFPRAE